MSGIDADRSRERWSGEDTWTMRGLSEGRPFVANMAETADEDVASAPRPYTVSVGKATGGEFGSVIEVIADQSSWFVEFSESKRLRYSASVATSGIGRLVRSTMRVRRFRKLWHVVRTTPFEVGFGADIVAVEQMDLCRI